MSETKPTFAEDFAGFVATYNFEDTSDAVRPYAETLAEGFYEGELELTKGEYEALVECFAKYVVDNLAEEADGLLQEWAENAREDCEARAEGLRSAYGII